MLNKKNFFICIDSFIICDGNDYDKIYKVLSTFKNKKLKINNILIGKYKDMIKNSDFEQNYWSRTAEGNYRIAHDSIRLMKWICYHDSSHFENIKYYDLMGTHCNHLNEISKR